MKTPFVTFMAFLICMANVNGQIKKTTAPQPEYLNAIYFIRQDSLFMVEKVQAEMKNKTKALGFGGSEAGYFIEGPKSPFRINVNDRMQFAVKLNSSMMDPTMMIKLYRFESGKYDREAILGGGGGMFNKKKDVGIGVEVPCNIHKSGSDVFVITPGSTLSSGEYGFLNMMMMTASGSKPKYTVFAFGVDQ